VKLVNIFESSRKLLRVFIMIQTTKTCAEIPFVRLRPLVCYYCRYCICCYHRQKRQKTEKNEVMCARGSVFRILIYYTRKCKTLRVILLLLLLLL